MRNYQNLGYHLDKRGSYTTTLTSAVRHASVVIGASREYSKCVEDSRREAQSAFMDAEPGREKPDSAMTHLISTCIGIYDPSHGHILLIFHPVHPARF
jgi:hypothetical protein